MAKALKRKPFSIQLASGEVHRFTHNKSLWRRFKRLVRMILGGMR